MAKRARTSSSLSPESGSKKARSENKTVHDASSPFIKVASAESAHAVDEQPPLKILLETMKHNKDIASKGKAVVYWMRMEDMRVKDNRAFSQASARAHKDGVPLLVLFIISPQDYQAHDRSPRRIDFMLRILRVLKDELDHLHIPIHVLTHKPRRTVPEKVISILEEWQASKVSANISYQVDELRRDNRVCKLGQKKSIACSFVQDMLVVDPGEILTKEGKAYSVYSPWQRKWADLVDSNMKLIEEAKPVHPNDPSVRSAGPFTKLFNSEIPSSVEGYECQDREKMKRYWPAGTTTAIEILEKFARAKASGQLLGGFDPLDGKAESSSKDSRLARYQDGRNTVDMNGTSRISPYLASGVISARECIRKTLEFTKGKKLEAGRNTGVGMWVQEIAWRDFYNHVMALYPRVSMGRPFLEKYADVKWETNEKHLQAWKEGKTGVPIVDAGMRQLNEMGWMHNRCRMITAMYLTKDLMLDWRLGERYFMEKLIDGDLPSNNGGWQWSASTGTDPQPYFRIFNPYSQSKKSDPSGDYIRHYVPELSKLKAIHEPPAEAAHKFGYPRPLVDHKSARDRALRRYKNPGEE